MPRELTATEMDCRVPYAKRFFASLWHYAKWWFFAWCVNLVTIPLLMVADLLNFETVLSLYYVVMLGVFFPPACFANPVVTAFLLGCFVYRRYSRRRAGNTSTVTAESVFIPW